VVSPHGTGGDSSSAVRRAPCACVCLHPFRAPCFRVRAGKRGPQQKFVEHAPLVLGASAPAPAGGMLPALSAAAWRVLDATLRQARDTAVTDVPELLSLSARALARAPFPASFDAAAALSRDDALRLLPVACAACCAVAALFLHVFRAGHGEPQTYFLARVLLLRGVGASYFAGFLAAALQARAIFGATGIAPTHAGPAFGVLARSLGVDPQARALPANPSSLPGCRPPAPPPPPFPPAIPAPLQCRLVCLARLLPAQRHHATPAPSSRADRRRGRLRARGAVLDWRALVAAPAAGRDDISSPPGAAVVPARVAPRLFGELGRRWGLGGGRCGLAHARARVPGHGPLPALDVALALSARPRAAARHHVPSAVVRVSGAARRGHGQRGGERLLEEPVVRRAAPTPAPPDAARVVRTPSQSASFAIHIGLF